MPGTCSVPLSRQFHSLEPPEKELRVLVRLGFSFDLKSPPRDVHNLRRTGLFLHKTNITRSPTSRKNTSIRSQKFPCPPFTPNSLGNCVLASCSATPALKPMRTVSETKFTTEPAHPSHARNTIVAVSRAVPAASAPKRRIAACHASERGADE